MSPQEAVKLRRDLRRQITRADRAAARCLAQVCDGDLRTVDRETAQKRLQLALDTGRELDRSLRRVENALNG